MHRACAPSAFPFRPAASALWAALACSGPVFLQPVFAQTEAPAGDTPYLETVTVIGTGLPTEVMHNPASIMVISAEDIAQTAPVSIGALLRDVPGVQVSEEGVERVAIRGESARRVAILIDGQRLTDHTNYGQPVLVDPTTIERIEVVRGASSVVSGSSAIGGVINIITKKGAAQPFSLSTTAGYLSATHGHRVSATAAGTVAAGAGALDYRLSLGRMKQGDRRTPDGRLEPSDVRDQNVSAHLGYRLGDHYFGLKAQAYDLGANVYTGVPDFLVSLPKRDLRKTALFYEGTQLAPWLTKLTLDAHHQRIERSFNNDISMAAGPMLMRIVSDSLDEQASGGVQARAEMKFSERSRTVAGLEWEDDALESDKTTTITRTPPGVTVPSLRFDDAKTRTLSVFGQHEWRFAPQWTATLGARGYRVRSTHNAATVNGVAGPTAKGSDSHVLGSAGLVWAPAQPWALRANVSQGYIYPTLAQLFLSTSGGGVTLVGNPDLKPETSTTYELGARYASGQTVLDVALFHARARDYISTAITGTSGTYQNVDTARSWGLDVQAEQGLGVWGLTPYTALTVMRRQLRYGSGLHTYDSGAPSIAGRVGLRKDWSAGRMAGSVDLFLRGESRVRLRADSGVMGETAAGYGVLGLRAHTQFAPGSSLVVELNNLTNRRYHPFSNLANNSYQPNGQVPGAKRSINVFLNYQF